MSEIQTFFFLLFKAKILILHQFGMLKKKAMLFYGKEKYWSITENVIAFFAQACVVLKGA